MFDVDKFYLMRKEFNTKLKRVREIKNNLFDAHRTRGSKAINDFIEKAIRPETRMQAYSEYPDLAKTFRETAFVVEKPSKGKAYRNNKIIDMNLAVLTHETTANKMLNPGGFEPQRRMGYLVTAFKSKIQQEIESTGEKPSEDRINNIWNELNAYEINDLKDVCMEAKNLCFIDTNTQFYEQNNAAGSILGMFAVQKIAHAALENDKFFLEIEIGANKERQFVFCDRIFKDFVEIDSTKNSKGEFIGKVLGSLVASAADAVKDPVLNLMNINKDTANVLTTMIRLGIPFEEASLLTSQSIIADCLQKYKIDNLTGFASFKSIIENKLKDLQKDNAFVEGDEASTEPLTREELIQGLLDTNNVNPKIQYKALLAFSKFMKMSNDIRGLTFATRFNSISNAVGPLIIDNLIMEEKEVGFSESILYLTKDAEGNQVFGNASLNTVFEKHPILNNFHKTVGIAKNIFGNNMPTNSRNFRAVFSSIPKNTKKKLTNNRKLLSKLADFYSSCLLVSSGCIDTKSSKGVSYYINDFPKEFFNQKIKDKYPNNPFIQAINISTTTLADGTEKFVLKLETTGMDTITKEKLSSGWGDLFETDFTLAMKLFKYCFYRGGIGFNPKTFMHLLPNRAKLKIDKYKESFTKSFNLIPSLVWNQFIRHNWQSNTLAPKIDSKETSGGLTISEDGKTINVSKNKNHLFEELNYCKLQINGQDVLFEIKAKTTYGETIITLHKMEPLGNNGEYLEIDSSAPINVTTESLTESTNDDMSPSTTESIEDGSSTSGITTTTYYEGLVQQLFNDAQLEGWKQRADKEDSNTKANARKWFEEKFKELGIPFDFSKFDEFYKTFCG